MHNIRLFSIDLKPIGSHIVSLVKTRPPSYWLVAAATDFLFVNSAFLGVKDCKLLYM